MSKPDTNEHALATGRDACPDCGEQIAALLATVKQRQDLWMLTWEGFQALTADYEARGREIERLSSKLDEACLFGYQTRNAYSEAMEEIERLKSEIAAATARTST